MRKKSFEKWGKPKIFNNIEDFKKSFTNESQVISIEDEIFSIDMLFRTGESDTLFVFFHAAMPAKSITLPFFQWTSLSELLNSSSLFISDPSLALSEDLDLAWYVGTRNFPAQEKIKNILSAVIETCNKRAIFVGSSGGAYPAIYYANIFENAAAYVNAPATSLKNHHSLRVLQKFAKICFETDYQPGFFESEAPWIVADLPSFIGGKLKNPLVITQNRSDNTYIEHHTSPLLESINLKWVGEDIFGQNLTLFTKDWGTGHIVPPASTMTQILKEMIKTRGRNFDCLKIRTPLEIVLLSIEKNSKNHYTAHCSTSENDCEFAFYLMCGSVTVDTQWYQSSNEFSIKPGYPRGIYTVKAFARRKSDKLTAIRSSTPFEID